MTLRERILGIAARQYLDHEDGITVGWLAWTVFDGRYTHRTIYEVVQELVAEGALERGHVGGYYLTERAERALHRVIS